MSFLRNFVSPRKNSDQEETKKSEDNLNKNDAMVEAVMFGADMGTCGFNSFFPANQQSEKAAQPKSQEPVSNQQGATQEELEELVRQNSLNPFI